MIEKECAILFSLFDGFGFQKISRIRSYFGSLAVAWENKKLGDWQNVGLPLKELERWFEYRSKVDLIEELKKIEKNCINYLCVWDDDYPGLLKEIYSPPVIIYFKGNIKIANRRCVGIVGTRNISDYGRRVTVDLVKDLTANQVVIVSGLAMGVDGVAHETSLKHHGSTIAVLGGGLDEIYPVVNARIAQEIIEDGGLLLSEFGVGVKPQKYHFPARNRIISGLSAGIVVIEAPTRSGALITADFALEQNRSVMAIPGGIYSQNSEGCNKLIQKGAVCVTEVNDILQELNFDNNIEMPMSSSVWLNWKPENKIEEKIVLILKQGEKYVDEIVVETGLKAAEINSSLNLMNLNGLVREIGSGKWSLEK